MNNPSLPKCASAWALPLFLAAALVLAGCGDDAMLMPPEARNPLFDRYVALGNSITAGFQSGGINVNTQDSSYAVLVAEQMETVFHIPALNLPGCPPPYVNVFTEDRLGPPSAPRCSLRDKPIPPFLNNVAVPGAEVIDLLSNRADDANPNPLTTILLGGRTQLKAAADAQPTFVSVWIGNNDVLGAALAGDASLITPVDAFKQRYTRILDSLVAMGVKGGILIGVADVTHIPHLTLAYTYYVGEAFGEFPSAFEVASNCADSTFGGVGKSTLVPFRYGFGVLLAKAQEGQPTLLECAPNTPVLLPEEIQTLEAAVQQYNAFIEQQAERLGWAYLNPNPLFVSREDSIPEFPNTPPLAEGESPFGPFFSLDGVHPSARAQGILANAVIEAINETYDTNIPPLEDESLQ